MSTLHFAIPEEFYAPVERSAVTKTFSTHTLLFQRGDPAQGVYLIRTGRVALSLVNVPTQPPRIVGPGTLLGLPSAMGGRPYSLTAEAIEPVEAGFIPREEVLNLLTQRTDICLAVAKGLATELTESRRQAAQLLEEQFQGLVSHSM